MAAVVVPVRTSARRAGDRAAAPLGCGDVEPLRVAPVCLTAPSLSAPAPGLLLFFTLVVQGHFAEV